MTLKPKIVLIAVKAEFGAPTPSAVMPPSPAVYLGQKKFSVNTDSYSVTKVQTFSNLTLINVN